MTTGPLSEPSAGETATRGARFWSKVPAILLISLIGAQLLVLHFVLEDPGFAVESDYYAKAAHFDLEAQQREANRSLGWSASATLVPQEQGSELRVSLLDRHRRPLPGAQVTLEAFPNARAAEKQHPRLDEVAPGVYSGLLRPMVGGLWELRLSAALRADRFTQTLRVELPLAARTHAP